MLASELDQVKYMINDNMFTGKTANLQTNHRFYIMIKWLNVYKLQNIYIIQYSCGWTTTENNKPITNATMYTLSRNMILTIGVMGEWFLGLEF